jgi:hypothetical protein
MVRKVRLITDVTSMAIKEEEMVGTCRLTRTNSLKQGAMWHVDTFAGQR